MPEAFAVLLVLLIPFALFAVWWIAVFNRLVGYRTHLRESWSCIEVELQRRLDLIPNLVETVKGYADHERDLLENVARLRSQQTDPLHAGARGDDERRVGDQTHRLLAVAEAHPDLKADAHFLRLQQELALTEDRIAAARRFYNANVRDLNEKRQQFPTNLVAAAAGIEAADYFQPEAGAGLSSPISFN